MKEQPIETRENGIEHSVGQRPIHTTYEPPGPLPQFRARPKLSQAQPTTQKQAAPSTTVKQGQNVSPEVVADSGGAASKKNS
jgi:hypothetical protein